MLACENEASPVLQVKYQGKIPPSKSLTQKRIEMPKSDNADYVIYPQAAESVSNVPWRIDHYDEAGIFTEDEISALANRFKMSLDLAKELSVFVGNCLDIMSAINLFAVSKSKSTKEGKRLSKTALRNLRADKSQEDVRAVLSKLSADFAANEKDAALLPAALKAKVITAQHLLEIINTPGSVAVMKPDAGHKTKDSRRYQVVKHCCYIWLDAGNRVTYTTVPENYKKGQRQGELIKFINMVIKLSTNPTVEISGETLRKDIDMFKKIHAEPSFMTEEPDFGSSIHLDS